jgi:cyanate permease
MAGLVGALCMVWLTVAFFILYRHSHENKTMQRNITSIFISLFTGSLVSVFFSFYLYYMAVAVGVSIAVIGVVIYDDRKN